MMPAGSQSPHSMRTTRWLTSMRLFRSARRKPQRAVEADHLAGDIGILDDVPRERGELIGAAEQLWKRHRGGETLLRFFRQCHQHRGVKNAWRDRVDANAELRELARRRQRQRGDAALGGGIGGL